MTTPDPGAHHGLKTTLKVGMEIHVELDTRSKMWTDAPNVAHPEFLNSEPNTLLSPVVIGMPGTLPVINEQAVEMSQWRASRIGWWQKVRVPVARSVSIYRSLNDTGA